MHYYKYQSQGLIYEKPGQDGDKKDPQTTIRPVRKIYINIDKEIANKMFGFRVLFEKDRMTSYCGMGKPAPLACQNHKPIHHLVNESLKAVTGRYHQVTDYTTKHTVMRILDSDHDDYGEETLAKRGSIPKNAPISSANSTLKFRKFILQLPWVFKDEETPETVDIGDIYKPTTLTRSNTQKKRFLTR